MVPAKKTERRDCICAYTTLHKARRNLPRRHSLQPPEFPAQGTLSEHPYQLGILYVVFELVGCMVSSAVSQPRLQNTD
jgi:hypothetical protein